jgi:hypothetical protein
MGHIFAQSNDFMSWERKKKTIERVRYRHGAGEREMENRVNMICVYEAEKLLLLQR